MIIIVNPLLSNRLLNSCRRVGVGNRVAINRSLVTGWHDGFSNRVADLLTSLVYWQVSPTTGPVAISCQFNGLDNLAISQEVNGNLSWTDAILIIIVDPLLRNRLRDSCWRVRVGDRVAINRSLVIGWHISFLPSVIDILTICLLCQVAYCSCPVIGGAQC